MQTSLSVTYANDEQKSAANTFAAEHSLTCSPYSEAITSLVLNFTADYLELKDREKDLSIHVDFISGNLAHRQQYGGGRGQAIAKAIGLKQGMSPPQILDATAGLGKDAFVLACLGCPVLMLERSSAVAALVIDALQRAEDDSEFSPLLNNGFSVLNIDSIEYMNNTEKKPEVIYLDPMYPDRKKSAAVKKNMQILQALLGKTNDNEALLTAALQCATKRVVVKRPKGAENIEGRKPTMSINSKKTRYDVYVIIQKDKDTV